MDNFTGDQDLLGMEATGFDKREESLTPDLQMLDTGEKTVKQSVKSYGIKIDRGQIKSIPVSQQASELKNLGVSVYEQEEFEQGVIEQVDKVLEEQEAEILRKSIIKELDSIRDDLRNTEEQVEKVEKAISSFEGKVVNDYDSRRAVEGLKKHREVKLKQLQKLQAREKYAIKKLEDSYNRKKGPEKRPDESEDNDNKSARFGEMTPFGNTCEEIADESSFSTEQNHDYGMLDAYAGDEMYDKIKKRKRLRIQDEFSDSYSSEDEFVPFEDEISEDEEEIDEEFDESKQRRKSWEYFPERKKPKKLGKHHKNLKAELKRKKVTVISKTVDDGNMEAYRERVRKVKIKEQLKKKGDLNAVTDELSDEEEGDIGDTQIGRGFRIPNKIWNRLYKYQRTGVKWMWELHCQEAGGIMGDEMGLGKTIQVIAFLAGLHYSKIGRRGSGHHGLGPVLIVCPATVLHQWVREFHKWFPILRVAVLHQTGSFIGSRDVLIRSMVANRGVLVTSYSNVRINSDELLRHRWDYIILDEGHKIRNPDAGITIVCKQFNTPHRLILSGSPMQNNLKELWSLLDFVFPGKLGTLPVFMTEFSVPITIGGYANASAVQVQTAYKCASILRDTINPYLLRRMKKDVKMSLQLPTKNEQVLFCRLTEEQRKLYKQYLDSRDVNAILSGRMKVFPGLIMLRKICNHPDLTSAAGSLEWMKEKGELGDDDSNEATVLKDDDFEGGYGHWQRSGKMIVVEALLRLWKQQGHRVLLFSQTKQMLDILESFVKSKNYSYLRMDGSTSIGSRQPSVEKFNADTSIFIYLLTTRVGGLGVNLIGGNRVVIFDPDWNPSTDTQARERAWRIGQDKHVTIYRLLTTGTIEEKIYHRQIFKQFLTNRVLTNPLQRRFFKANDLFELFTLGDTEPKHGTETSAIFAGTGSEVKIRKKESVTDATVKKKAKTSVSVNKVKLQKKDKLSKKRQMLRERARLLAAKISANKLSTKETSDKMDKDISSDRSDIQTASDRASEDFTLNSEIDSCLAEKNEVDIKGMKSDKNNDLSSPLSSKTFDVHSVDTPKADKCDSDSFSKELVENSHVPPTKTSVATGRKGEHVPIRHNVLKVESEKTPKTKQKAVVALQKKRKVLKKKRKLRDATVEGSRISHLDRHDSYRRNDDDDEEEEDKQTKHKKHDDEILTSLFQSTGVHSALKHDRIEDAGNPDYVLVEKEAERVAKQAADALKRSRSECRLSGIGVPTWTGSQGSAGIPSKPRFGTKKKISETQTVKNRRSSSEGGSRNASGTEDEGIIFGGQTLLQEGEKNTDPLSSESLLARMRTRNYFEGRNNQNDLDPRQHGPQNSSQKTENEILLEEIRDFVAYSAQVNGQASTKEILNKFQARISAKENALFKEMLKQVCTLKKISGQGVWILKEEYK